MDDAQSNSLTAEGDSVRGTVGSVEPAFLPEVQFKTTIGCSTGEGDTDGQQAQDELGDVATDGISIAREILDSSELVLLDLLGSGAQAEVYRGIWWRSFGSTTSAITVAVKRLSMSSGPRAHDCESLAHGISHPNLVKCFEASTKPPYLIVSEFCAGGSLYDVVHDSKEPLSWRQRLKILLDVASGMEYLHNRKPKILHRDLKSCNVLLTKPITGENQKPVAKVADFGLSRVLKASQDLMMTRCVGTWRWMAPEVFSSNEYNESIDVFSFGILMFEVLSREVPYVDKWPVHAPVNPRIGLHIMNGHRPNVKLVQHGCPGKIVELMQECWCSEPSSRPEFSKVKKEIGDQLELVNLYTQVKHMNSPF